MEQTANLLVIEAEIQYNLGVVADPPRLSNRQPNCHGKKTREANPSLEAMSKS
jgi:hypothetical protein